MPRGKKKPETPVKEEIIEWSSDEDEDFSENIIEVRIDPIENLVKNTVGPGNEPLNLNEDQQTTLIDFFRNNNVKRSETVYIMNEIAIYGYDEVVSKFGRSFKEYPGMKSVRYKNLMKNLNDVFSLDNVEGEEKCPRCNGNNTIVTSRQLRAADEAATVLGFCRNCNREFRP